ncbi:hypothetical protein B0H66DRAFT_611023 [Apodospora peruviana]|uniref:Uncharacterized protein n=1 Tax=Apodospora peruviana TaxID=516989 RepID=A0AAE0IRR0_9PEZI|nr:hypothetical protein B0H66DRAFT_611023 [Apodospora peruviana]
MKGLFSSNLQHRLPLADSLKVPSSLQPLHRTSKPSCVSFKSETAAVALGALLLLEPTITHAFLATCFTGRDCTGSQGAIVGADYELCINVVGRKSWRLWGHQGPGGGPGKIRYTGCLNCKSNCDGYTCQSKYVGQGNSCWNLNPDNYPGAFFYACPACSCLIGKRDNGTEEALSEDLKERKVAKDLIS